MMKRGMLWKRITVQSTRASALLAAAMVAQGALAIPEDLFTPWNLGEKLTKNQTNSMPEDRMERPSPPAILPAPFLVSFDSRLKNPDGSYTYIAPKVELTVDGQKQDLEIDASIPSILGVCQALGHEIHGGFTTQTSDEPVLSAQFDGRGGSPFALPAKKRMKLVVCRDANAESETSTQYERWESYNQSTVFRITGPLFNYDGQPRPIAFFSQKDFDGVCKLFGYDGMVPEREGQARFGLKSFDEPQSHSVIDSDGKLRKIDETSKSALAWIDCAYKPVTKK